jgi:hypothetical protein
MGLSPKRKRGIRIRGPSLALRAQVSRGEYWRMISVKRNPSRRELRTFGWVILGGFCVIGLLLWRRGGWAWTGSGRQYAAAALMLIGAAVACVSAMWPTLARRLYIAWMTVGMVLGTGMSILMLTLMFFLVLPVFALIRLKDPLRMKLHGQASYWEEPKPQEASIERMMRPF